MTQLQQIRAFAHPRGNRIDLSWVNPDPVQYPRVRIRRREGTYPTDHEDGDLVADVTNGTQFTDTPLKGETVYYYGLFPGGGSPLTYVINNENRVAAMATGAYDMAEMMAELIPTIYHRYDTAKAQPPLPEDMAPEDAERGQMRRFLNLPGSQLDQLYSDARSLMDLLNIDKLSGHLLPLLAQWIGWETNHRLEYDSQRNEIRNAPALYQRVGIIPTAEAIVKRLLDWESRTKEFVHNVFISNQPERLNLWATERLGPGSWVEPIAPLSLDYTFEGRPAVTRTPDGTLWLFYHTQRNGHWDIWHKTLTHFSLDSARQPDLKKGYVTNLLQAAFEAAGFRLAETAIIEAYENTWHINDLENGLSYTVKLELGQLVVYHWSPSQPLTKRSHWIDKHPVASVQGNRLWLFWEAYNPQTGQSTLQVRTKLGDTAWSNIQTLTFLEGGADVHADRRNPTTAVDHLGQLWLFWQERNGRRWQLKYNRHNGSIWVLSPPLTFPPAPSGEDPQVDADPFVLFQPEHPGNPPRLWLFWARRVPVPGQARQTRWEIAYRVATGLDPTALTWIRSWSSTPPHYLEHRTVDTTVEPVDTRYRTWYVNKPLDWGPVQTLPKPIADYDDREPAALLDSSGNVELFWSSNRDRSWSIWRSTLVDLGANTWSSPAQIRGTLYSQRAPLPYDSPTAGTQLLFRSNQSVAYQSSVYRATRTVDFRYGGATTVDSRNVAKNNLQGQFRDFQTYTFDTGDNGKRNNQNWYARDTIAIYLTPTTENPTAIVRDRNLIQKVLAEFLPIQVRAVLVIEPPPYRDAIYTYDTPEAIPQHSIGENAFDSQLPETLAGLKERYEDRVPGWIWFHSWCPSHASHQTVDFRNSPVDTRYRSWHTGLVSS